MLDSFLQSVDATLWRIGHFLGLSASRYCDIETVDEESDHAMVTRDGGLVSLLSLAGTGRMVGEDEFDRVVFRLSSQLRSYLSSPSHAIQVVFVRDTSTEAVEREIVDILGPSIETSRRLNIDLDDVIDQQAAALGRYCASERIYLAAWTTPAALAPVERRIAENERARSRKHVPFAPDSQRRNNLLTALREAHNALVGSLVGDFADAGYRLVPLAKADALRAIRAQVDADWTADDWRPAYPGDGADPLRRARAAEQGTAGADASSLLWPNMEEQLIPRGFRLVNGRVVQSGDRLFLPMVISLPPAELQPFDRLFERLADSGVSYRMSWRLSGSGVNDTEVRIRGLMAFFSTSKTSKAAHAEAVSDVQHGNARVALQMDVVVWRDALEAGASEMLLRDGARVARAIQGWGGCEVDERLGSPVAAMCGSVPALLPTGYGVVSVPPIEDAVALLPIGRPASPWKVGSMVFRTPDGKLYPYQPYSNEQGSWVELIFAPMRAGKSVLAAALNKALCLRAGLDRLPFISILDIGPSSVGLISLLQEALPEHLKHQVVARRLRMDVRDAINPCDTMLGMRKPLPAHRAFIVNFLTLLATPIGDDAAPGDIPLLAGACVDEAYAVFADNGRQPRNYSRLGGEIDQWVDHYGIHYDQYTLWWDIVDAFFDVGDIHAAQMAQRFAVPLLGDIGAMAVDPKISSQFKGIAPNGETIVDYFSRVIQQSTREYPVLASPTRFGIGDARIVSLDLADVAPKGGGQADRQTGVMYMLARHALASRLFLTTEDLDVATMPDKYRAYHYREVQLIADDPKALFLDEFHRTADQRMVREQIVTDIREGPKSKLRITLSSQRLKDFDAAIVDLATTIFVLGIGNTGLSDILSTFQLGSHAATALNRIGKPTSAGARLVAVFKTRTGDSVVELMHTLSPVELWAYGTTSEDRGIRDRLYRRIGPREARLLLAAKYPSGTAIEEVERRRADMGARGLLVGTAEEVETTLIERMVNELVAEHEAR